ncbi:hypothetical protein [Singulisphaera acidiphila]|uniref:Uncharacterized protein n=1 Tax=Singulisphaera acidiphila (strain ATCC BAA-1392 / DSM 18658 / VKM B-2454 / MOB10) TaxID=886293 RepID=L0D828_SINAD|nr:hypothetical protein [Singulisphaera acidiphila]AGA25025.1 hypothetical protein Sinac_0606 [Singulisphaera acidiphila DSM 18658]
MIRSIGYLAMFVLAGSPLWAGELDAEYGAKTPIQSPAVTLASGALVPHHVDKPDMVSKGSELDSERAIQAWRHFGGFGRGFGFGGWNRGFGFGGWNRGFGFGGWNRGFGYGGWNRGFGFGGYGLGYGLGYGGYGLGYGGFGYSYLPVTYYSTPYLSYGGFGYGMGCW